MYKAIMDDSRLNNINRLREFLESSKNLVIKIDTIDDKYSFIQGVITKFKYKKLNKKDKHIIVLYIRKCTGYKKAQTKRLIAKAVKNQLFHKKYIRTNPSLNYKAYDIKCRRFTTFVIPKYITYITSGVIER